MADTPKWVFGAPVSPAARLLVSLLWTYAKHGEDDPFVFPSRAKLAALTGQTKRGIIKQLASLRVAGVLSTSIRGKRWGFILRSTRTEQRFTVGTTVQVNDGSDGEQRDTACTAVPSGVNSGAAQGEQPFRLEGTAVHTEAPVKPQLESPVEANPLPPPGETLVLVTEETNLNPVDGIWAHHDEVRMRSIKNSKPLDLDPDRRKAVAKILKAYGAEEVRRVIDVLGAKAATNATTAHYWKGDHLWILKNFRRYREDSGKPAPGKRDGIRSGSFRAEDAEHGEPGESWL